MKNNQLVQLTTPIHDYSGDTGLHITSGTILRVIDGNEPDNMILVETIRTPSNPIQFMVHQDQVIPWVTPQTLNPDNCTTINDQVLIYNEPHTNKYFVYYQDDPNTKISPCNPGLEIGYIDRIIYGNNNYTGGWMYCHQIPGTLISKSVWKGMRNPVSAITNLIKRHQRTPKNQYPTITQE